MSEEIQTPETDEMTILKGRADMLGVSYSNNIGIDTLRKRVAAAQEGKQAEDAEAEADNDSETEEAEAEAQPNPLNDGKEVDLLNVGKGKKLSHAQIRSQLLKEATKLVRLRITNLNPNKKDIPGEILTVGNKYIGTIKKYVPFGEATDNGFHVPHCLYELMKERKFLQTTQKRDRRTGTNTTKTRWVREFALEVLEPLTKEELAKLAQDQRAGNRIGDDDD